MIPVIGGEGPCPASTEAGTRAVGTLVAFTDGIDFCWITVWDFLILRAAVAQWRIPFRTVPQADVLAEGARTARFLKRCGAAAPRNSAKEQ